MPHNDPTAATRDGEAGDRAVFARLLFLDSEAEARVRYGEATMAGLAASAFDFVVEKAAGQAKIRCRDVMPAAGSEPAATILEIVNDDMPFLVDSVMGEIQARDIPVHLVLHPLLKTARNPEGRLVRLLGPGDESWQSGQESFIQVHLDPIARSRADELVAELGRILDQVRLAVGDWRGMVGRIRAAIEAYRSSPPPVSEAELRESIAFLEWLADDNFTFLGMRELALVGDAQSGDLETRHERGLGILRDPEVRVLRRGTELVHMTPEMRRFYFQPAALIISKANTQSKVHRRAHLDYVGIKTYGPQGGIIGELRVVGLFTSAAYTRPARAIPFIRLKIDRVVAALGYPPDSHSGKAVLNILETFPRDELFQIGPDLLERWTAGILDLDLRPRVRVFTRVDEFDRFVSALVYVPRDRFSTEVRLRIGELLAEACHGRIAAFYPNVTSAPLVRIQFIVARHEGPTPPIRDAELEPRVAEIVQSWQDGLQAALRARHGLSGAEPFVGRYAGAFPAGYRESFGAARALADIERIEALSDGQPVGIDFYRDEAAPPARLRAALYRLGEPLPLSERVPLLENLGFRVIDERSYSIRPQIGGERRVVRLHDMVLESDDGSPIAFGEDDLRLEACFLAVLDGRAENDAYNRLVKAARLDWRGAALARAFGAYLRQIGSPFPQRYMADTLARHSGVVADLALLFATRFDPDLALSPDERRAREAEIRTRIETAVSGVQSLDEDRILRSSLNLMLATKRTNYYQRLADGSAPPAIACKLASAEIEGLPAPRPFAEIWVHGPRVEGVHLRFAPIARGGLRWSDRPQDFRTEVLGLVKAQQVKNTVIVPQGAKGGFVPKRLPAGGSREAVLKEGIAAYELFVSSLLELTDNLLDGRVVPPVRVVRHDGDDPYLVVAADKGTATFSDIANAISARHGFWLGDAFASGGSAGYDHKKIAITARGGWECVKRHFREMDIDIQTTPFHVVGVGDMSGDVFGNAMLLSPEILLRAAFDHRDILIDPRPDAVRGLAERRRLFELPRSSWQDYDRAALGPGGGVYSRQAKAITPSPEARAWLGLPEGPQAPEVVMRAILKAEADLLWFGGIGTFVRASGESNEQVGDRSNDAIRVTAREVRAKVVGEGANLAMTQRARIELAQAGCRLNTDFIDNSAGVNSSDQEVNIKIALGRPMAEGTLPLDERNRLLTAMTGEVIEACLANNYQQSLVLSLGQDYGLAGLGFQQRLMRELEHQGMLDRQLESLPSDMEMAARAKSGQPLTRPELAVLLSYAKIDLSHRLLASHMPDDPYFEGRLASYFPSLLRRAYPEAIARHPLRREIVATLLTNEAINRGGSTMVVRLTEETGHDAAQVVGAFEVVRAVFDLPGLWRRIDALDNKVTGATQIALYRATQELVRKQTTWFLRHTSQAAGLGNLIRDYEAGAATFRSAFERVLPARRRARLSSAIADLQAAGVPADLAWSVAALEPLGKSGAITLSALTTGRHLEEVALLLGQIGEHFRLDELDAAAAGLSLTDYFDRLAIDSALGIVADAERNIAVRILREAGGSAPDFAGWLAHRGNAAQRARDSLDEIIDSGTLTLARLTVAASQMRDLEA